MFHAHVSGYGDGILCFIVRVDCSDGALDQLSLYDGGI
jgi:hypothetical protein